MRPGPKWMSVYELLITLNVGDVVTHEQLMELAGKHYQPPFYRAAREFLHVDHRAMESVRGVGYRVVQAAEQARLAEGFKGKAVVALHRGVDVATNVRRDELSDAERAQNDFAQIMLGRAFRDIKRKFDEHEERIESLEKFVGVPTAKVIDIAEAR